MIQVRHLRFSYARDVPRAEILKGIDLSLREGEWVALIGANGSGKTTFLRCLNGLLRPTRGDVLVDGHSVLDVEGVRAVRRRVGMVFQNPDDQIVSAQVEREVAFGLENLGVPTEVMQGRVDEVLERFGLLRSRRHPPHLLSGGERQRLAIASVVAMRPRYLLLDEPTALLDPAARIKLRALLKELHRSGEVTPLLVTQDPEEALAADRILVFDQGRVVMDGPPSEVYSQVAAVKKMGLAPPAAAWIAFQAGLPPPVPLTAAGLVDGLPPLLSETPPPRTVPATPPARPSVISAQKICHVYDPGLSTVCPAVVDVDLDVPEGCLFCLIGPSGSGKSTLLQHLNGLLQPTSGELTVCGVNLRKKKDLSRLRRRVGLLFQFPEAQLFAETVYDDVAFGPRSLGLDDVEARVREALTQVGIEPDAFLPRSPFALSSGEKRRVATAGVLAMRPDVLVLDEPTAGLDPAGVEEVEGYLRAFQSRGSTVILVSHDMGLVSRLGERVAALDRGRLCFDTHIQAAFSDRKRLRSLSLDWPEPVAIADGLRRRGWPIPEDVLTADGLGRSLRSLLERT